MTTDSASVHVTRLEEREFRRIADFLYKEAGIRLAPAKRTMVEGRLRRHLVRLGLGGYEEYCRLVFDTPAGVPERVHLVDSLTTNKTDFYREPEHFRFLVETGIAEIHRNRDVLPSKGIRIWSAGCSSGEEPYTLAMVLSEVKVKDRPLRFRILGTDISTQVLAAARRAIYPESRIDPIPKAVRQKHLLRSRDPAAAVFRIAPETRAHVTFQEANLMDRALDIGEKADAAFFRNVMIYFDPPTQQEVIRRICRNIHPGGFLFLGHSESTTGMDVPLEAVRPTVYRVRR